MTTKRRHRVIGLDDFQLSLAGLTRLGVRPVSLSVQLAGRSVSSLRRFQPKQRNLLLRGALTEQLQRLRRRFPKIQFVSLGKRTPSWTIDALVPARQVRELAGTPEVNVVHIDKIHGRRKKPRPREQRWFCVWGVVALQIEKQVKGFITLEDRLVLVRANDVDDAERRLQREWERYAEPYLNTDGYLVRWQLVSVRDVYELNDDNIDPHGTEVYSQLRNARLRPEHRWRTNRELKGARTK